jgi:inner membrane protein
MAADLDVLIRSPSDPLLGLEFHRHFTHSISFIPIGGLLCALPWLLRRSEHDKRGVLAATMLGYATHAFLDAFTSYGTMLWWPFSDVRVAWNVISIVDPLFTLPLIAGVMLTLRRDRRALVDGPATRAPSRPARVGLAIAWAYMALCGVQRARALEAQSAVMKQRGHPPGIAHWRQVYPLFGINNRWRSVYEHDGRLWADAFHTRWLGRSTRWVPGTSTERLQPDHLPPAARGDDRTMAAHTLFVWFSGDRLLGYDIDDGFRICDTRYSMDPEAFSPMFCLDLHPDDATPVRRPSMRRKGLGRAVEKFFPGVGEIPTRAVPGRGD